MAPLPDDEGDRKGPGSKKDRRRSPSPSSSSGTSTSGSSSSDSGTSSDSDSRSPLRDRKREDQPARRGAGTVQRDVERVGAEPFCEKQQSPANEDAPRAGHGNANGDGAEAAAEERPGGVTEGPSEAHAGGEAPKRPSVFDRLGGPARDNGAEGRGVDRRGRWDAKPDDDRWQGGHEDGDRGRDRDRDHRGDRYDARDDKARDRDRERDRDRGRGYDDRERDRDRGYDRGRGREYDDRDRDRDKDRDRGRDYDRYRGGSDRDRDRERERDRDRYGSGRDQGRDYDDRDRDRGRSERDRDRDRGRNRDGSPRKGSRDDEDDIKRRGGKAGGDAAAAGGGEGARAEDAAAGAAGPGAEVAAEPVVRKAPVLGKTGGVYIPPFKLARMMAEQAQQDRASPEFQRLTWEALKKSLNGIINKVNTVNIKNILPEVFRENLVRGRGLFCRSLMKSQAASPSFTPVYAALVAVVNTKFPEIGELLLSRLILQFKRSYKRNDKPVCTAASKFIAHLVNQGVAHEVLALEVLILLLEVPSEDSVEMAVEFVKEVGAHLQEVAPQGLHGVFERFRAILHEGAISKRVQFIIEGMFALRKAGFEKSGFPALKPELDLVEAEDQITHELGLDDELQAQTMLDVFRVDPSYEEEERKYAAIAKEILGEEDEEEEEEQEGAGQGDGGEAAPESSSGEESDDDDDGEGQQGGGGAGGIHDATATNLVNLRRTIYLTLMSSFDFEEAGHKLLKIQIQPGQEIELVTMIIECCSQERTFKRFYGLLAQRFCYINKTYAELFEDCFQKQYSVIHRLETNKLRNVSCLFAHLLATDALPWSALTAIRLTEEDTTSSSRIFIKYLFQELSSTMGLVKLNARLNDPAFSPWFEGLFPRDSLQHMRFSINFFTSIGLGGVTDVMRDNYKASVAAQAAAQQQQVAKRVMGSGSESSSDSGSESDNSSSDSGSSSNSGSSSSGSDSSGSESEDSRRRSKGRKRSKGKEGKRGGDKGRDKKRRR